MTEICSLDDARAFLLFPDSFTEHDELLSGILIPAATREVESIVGAVVPRQYDETYDGGDYTIKLRHSPVLSVETIIESWGFTNFTLDYQDSTSVPAPSIYAYSLDMPTEGIVSRRSAGNVPMRFVAGESNIRAVYTAGRESIPEHYYLAGLELVAHWYRGSLQRFAAGGSGGSVYDATAQDFTRSTGVEMPSYGIPNVVVSLLERSRKAPIIG